MKSKLAPLAFAFAALLLALAPAATAGDAASKPIVIHAAHHDISPPLRDMAIIAPPALPSGRIFPLRATPPRPGANASVGEDRALQKQVLPLVNTIPGIDLDGIGADGVAPPDTTGAVGDNVTGQYVQMVNEEYEVINKNTGATILGPTSIDAIWSGFGHPCANSNGGDVDVVFDKAAARWVISQLSNNFTSYCIAVSSTDDATGSYARYEFDFGSNIPDYPKLGVWPDAYYWTSNTFQNGSNFIGAMPCAYDRTSMLSGGPANAICFQQNSGVASLLPSDLDGSTAPPAGEPNFYVELLDNTHLGLFKFHVDFGTPANSTFTGPTSIAVSSYTQLGSVPQPLGDGTQLDSLSDRLMYRLAYRNFGDHEALVVTHSVVAGSSGGARWYEIRSPNATPAIFQQGTFAPDSTFRWMGSIAMDKSGDIALGYSASSSSVHPAVRYTGRVPTDPQGQMETEASIFEGAGSQNGGLSRWGDYSSMTIDPGDDCTFFYTTEYIPSDGSFNWHTRIGSFKFAGCGSTTPDFFLSSSPSSQSVIQGQTATYTETVNPINGYTGTVGLSVSGCPTGATCSISPNSVGPPYNPSTLSVATSSTTPGGNYVITITGTDGTLTHTTSVSLAVKAPDFSISGGNATQTIKVGGTVKYNISLSSINSFAGSVSLTVTGLPARATAAFSPNPVTLASGGTATSVLTVTTAHKSPPGKYTLTITGKSGTITHTTTVVLTLTAH